METFDLQVVLVSAKHGSRRTSFTRLPRKRVESVDLKAFHPATEKVHRLLAVQQRQFRWCELDISLWVVLIS